jgi:hypothetical protein
VRRGLVAALLAVTLPAVAAAAPGARKPKAAPVPPAPVPATPEPPIPPPVDTPWSQGVPAEQQQRANALFDEGNQLFGLEKHAPALEKYRAALALWDHPLIRFNLAVTLIRLDRPLEAAEELERALRFGATPFKPENYQEALDYQALLKGRVGEIHATCTQADVKVQLDGKPWFDCPGDRKQRVMAGPHAVTGERPLYLTVSQRLVIVGGSALDVKVNLVPLDSAVVLRYPHPRWLPWTIVGSSAAIGLGGVAFYLSGRSGIQQFDVDFTKACEKGCEPGLTAPEHHSLAGERDTAELQSKIGVTMMGIGGATAVAGVVFLILNRPERILPNMEVSPTAGGMQASAMWRF